MNAGAKRPRQGSAILLVIFIVGMTAAILTWMVPALVRANRIARIQASVDIMSDLAYELYNNVGADKDFRQVITVHAGRLSQLVVPLAAGALDICGDAISAGDRGLWDDANNGPFSYYPIVANTGLYTPLGQVNDLLVNITNTTQAMTISNADREDVQLADMLIDISDGNAAGSIRWGTTGTDGTFTTDGRTTMSFAYTTSNAGC